MIAERRFPSALTRDEIAARVAVQLARTSVGAGETIDDLARAALEVARAAMSVRRCSATKRDASKWLHRIENVVSKYGARVVSTNDPFGMSVGLQFKGGGTSAGFSNTFFVS